MGERTPEISVIVPVYNGASTLKRCLDSILSQTFSDFEIIVVDDGSTDDTLKLLREYARRDQRVKVFSKRNGGVSSARNVGLKQAKGRYIQFIDADDHISPRMFNAMYTMITATDADVVTCRFEHDCWKPFLPGGVYYMGNRKDCLRFFSDFFTFNVPWNKLIRRGCITSYFNEDIHFFEDGLFILDNLASIKRIVVLEDVYYHYFNAAADANSAVNAFLKTRFWETRQGYWFRQLNLKEPFNRALERIGFERPESFIRTRMFDMAFVELVKLIASGVSKEACLHEMYAIFSDPIFQDSLKLFTQEPFHFNLATTFEFIERCFSTYESVRARFEAAQPKTKAERDAHEQRIIQGAAAAFREKMDAILNPVNRDDANFIAKIIDDADMEPFFSYMNHFFATFNHPQLDIRTIIANRLKLELPKVI